MSLNLDKILSKAGDFVKPVLKTAAKAALPTYLALTGVGDISAQNSNSTRHGYNHHPAIVIVDKVIPGSIQVYEDFPCGEFDKPFPTEVSSRPLTMLRAHQEGSSNKYVFMCLDQSFISEKDTVYLMLAFKPEYDTNWIAGDIVSFLNEKDLAPTDYSKKYTFNAIVTEELPLPSKK